MVLVRIEKYKLEMVPWGWGSKENMLIYFEILIFSLENGVFKPENSSCRVLDVDIRAII